MKSSPVKRMKSMRPATCRQRLPRAIAARFHPGMSTEFIERIGDMINVTLTRFGIEPDV